MQVPTIRALIPHLAVAVGWLIAAGVACADPAAELAQLVYDRPAGRDVTTVSRMELIEKGRTPRTRTLVAYRLNKDGGEVAHLIRFLEPADIAGTGLLSTDKPDGTNEQSLYLPSLDRARRISGDRKGGRFVGSELYYEDLQDRKPARDRHRLLGRDTVDGVACDLLESVPVDKASSVYRRRVSCVDRQAALIVRVDYFENDDTTPSKRWLLVGKKRQQGFWTVTESRMIDLASGRETRLLVDSVAYDKRLPAKLFTTQALADENMEMEYRP
jgi:hypothetical protein